MSFVFSLISCFSVDLKDWSFLLISPTLLLLYSLNTPENQRLSGASSRYKRGTLARNGLNLVPDLKNILDFIKSEMISTVHLQWSIIMHGNKWCFHDIYYIKLKLSRVKTRFSLVTTCKVLHNKVLYACLCNCKQRL